MGEVIYLEYVRKGDSATVADGSVVDGQVADGAVAPAIDLPVDDSVPILEVDNWACPGAYDYVQDKNGVAGKMRTLRELKEMGEGLRQARAELYVVMRTFYVEGRLLMASGQHEEAYECFGMIIKSMPAGEVDERDVCDEAVKIVYGALCAGIESCSEKEAREYFELVLRLRPEYAVVFISKGEEALVNGDFVSAHRCFAAVLAVNPKNRDILIAQAQTYVAQKDFANAHKCFDQLGKKRMMDPFLINSRGYAYFAQGDFKNARKCFDSVLKSSPRNQFAMNMIGQIYLAEGNLEKARECFEAALKVFPDNRIAIYFSAKILIKQGKKPEAKAFLRKRLQLPPVNIPTLMLFAMCTGPDDPLWDEFSSNPEVGPAIVNKAKAVYENRGALEREEHLFWQRNILLWDEGAKPVNRMAAAGMVGYSTVEAVV